MTNSRYERFCGGEIMAEKSLNEKMLLVSIIGTLEALKENGLTINEAEKYLFSPHIIQRLKEWNYDEKIIDIIEKGCELEDIASLLPLEFVDGVEKLKKETLAILKQYKVYEHKFWI